MRKNFITNISFLLLLNLLIKPFWILGIDRSVQNTLGPETYGVYFALFNFSYLFQVILDFGINNFNNRLVAREPGRLGSHLFSTLMLKIGLSLAYTGILFIAAVGVQFSGAQLQILGQLALLQIGISFYAFLRSNINALHLFRTDAFLSILDKLITSILCGLVLWTNVTDWQITIPLFIGIQIVGYALSILAATLIIARQRIRIAMQMNIGQIRDILRNSLPYALLGFLMTAYYRTDGVMLERMLGDRGDYQAGVYASAFRLLDALSILGFLFAGLLMPMFARMLEKNEPIAPLFRLGYTLMLIFSAASGITFIFYREEIMHLLYHNPDPDAGAIFGWLMVSFIAISITYIYGSLLTAHGSIRTLNLVSLGGFFLNITLNAILIPGNMALGSAIATVLAQVVILGAHVYQARRLHHTSVDGRHLMRSVTFLALVIGINYGCGMLPMHWGICLGLAGALSALAAIPAGLIRIADIRTRLDAFMAKAGPRSGS